MSLREAKCVGNYKTYWQPKSKRRENVYSLITERLEQNRTFASCL